MREVRKDAGLTARALAAATGQHFTRVSKIENGTQAPTDKDIRAWCTACHADDQVMELIATARAVESAYLEFKRQSRAGLKRVVGPFTQERYEATGLFRVYEHNIIPGLFQTPEYCAAMASFWIPFLGIPDDLQDTVRDRMRGRRSSAGRKGVPRRAGGAGPARVVRHRAGAGGPARPAARCDGAPGRDARDHSLMRERSGAPCASSGSSMMNWLAWRSPTRISRSPAPTRSPCTLKMFSHLDAAAVHGAQARALIEQARRKCLT